MTYILQKSKGNFTQTFVRVRACLSLCSKECSILSALFISVLQPPPLANIVCRYFLCRPEWVLQYCAVPRTHTGISFVCATRLEEDWQGKGYGRDLQIWRHILVHAKSHSGPLDARKLGHFDNFYSMARHSVGWVDFKTIFPPTLISLMDNLSSCRLAPAFFCVLFFPT